MAIHLYCCKTFDSKGRTIHLDDDWAERYEKLFQELPTLPVDFMIALDKFSDGPIKAMWLILWHAMFSLYSNNEQPSFCQQVFCLMIKSLPELEQPFFQPSLNCLSAAAILGYMEDRIVSLLLRH